MIVYQYSLILIFNRFKINLLWSHLRRKVIGYHIIIYLKNSFYLNLFFNNFKRMDFLFGVLPKYSYTRTIQAFQNICRQCRRCVLVSAKCCVLNKSLQSDLNIRSINKITLLFFNILHLNSNPHFTDANVHPGNTLKRNWYHSLEL